MHCTNQLLVHCLHLDDSERRLIRSSPAWVVHNPESNMHNRVGHFDSRELGGRIFFGTDGMHGDMLQSTRAAYLIGRQYDPVDIPTTLQRLRNVHNYLQMNSFSGDADNNLVVFDYDNGTEMNQDNFSAHLIFGLGTRHVQHVISQGKLIVRDRKIQTVDETEILHTSRKLANKLWDKMRR